MDFIQHPNTNKTAENIKFIQNLKINECKMIIYEYKMYIKKQRNDFQTTYFRQFIAS